MMGAASQRAKVPYRRFSASGRASWSAKNRRNTALSGNLRSLGVDEHCIKDGVAIDPACGSGNFLTETYISIRRLENEALKTLNYGQITFEQINPIKVSIGQFYGIEINDFAVTVGKTALWIAESQMMKETEDIIHMNLEFLPLKSYANIIDGNALELDWGNVVPKLQLTYIMGNPPFAGVKLQSNQQRKDMQTLAGADISKVGLLDYVCGWYIKAARFISGTNIRCSFVSTNSITQGEQPAILWKYLLKLNVEIDYGEGYIPRGSAASA